MLQVVEKYQTLTVHDVAQGTSSCVQTKGPKVFEVGNRCWNLGKEVELSNYASKEELVEVCILVTYGTF